LRLNSKSKNPTATLRQSFGWHSPAEGRFGDAKNWRAVVDATGALRAGHPCLGLNGHFGMLSDDFGIASRALFGPFVEGLAGSISPDQIRPDSSLHHALSSSNRNLSVWSR
jgi:hypothetical protein